MNSKISGIFVISLDFEMMWGAKDWSTPENYGKSNVAQVPQVIDKLLKLFLKYGVHATFATVGFIFCCDKEDLLSNLPIKKPSYEDSNLSPYSDNYIENISKEYENLYFAPELIRKISNTEGMEIATHTACHYNCTAQGQTPEEFDADLKAAKEIGKRGNVNIRSIIFPRNEVVDAYLKVCRDNGVLIYRGNAKKYFGHARDHFEVIRYRICRFLDNYVPLDKYTTYPVSEVKAGEMYNVRASRFLRPYSSYLSLFDGLRLLRMKLEMEKAAKNGEIYHIWWHPHNFGSNIDENFKFLEKLLEHYTYCRNKYGMMSMNMQEIVKEAIDF